MDIILLTISIIIILALLVFFVIWQSKRMRRERIRKSLNLKLLLIRLPHPDSKKEGQGGNFKEEVNLSEQLFSILSSLKGGATFEASVHHLGEEIHFYVAVPEKDEASVSRQIEGLFKDAQIEHASDYNIFQPGGFSDGFYLKQDNHYALLLRTYLESDIDTFSPILSSLSKINEVGEGVSLQVIIRPAPDSFKKNIFNLINRLKKGESFKKIASQNFINIKEWGSLLQMENKDGKNPSIVDESSIKALEQKVGKPLVKVDYRVLVSTVSKEKTDAIINSILGSFYQFEAPLKNKIKVIKAKNINKFAYQFTFREFDDSQAMILNTEELTGLFHMPSSSTLAPRIKWLKSKEVPPPSNLSSAGTKIGDSMFNGIAKPIYISDEDRRRHVYIIGQTGTGKTALITNMAADDIAKGKGVAVIDPHGDLVEKICSLVPKEREKDVIYFDPGHLQKPIGLNFLEYDFDKPEQKTFIVNEMLGILDKLYDLKTTGGPMFEQYMRNALLLLMEDAPNEPATLMEIPRIFSDEEYRKRKVARITNPVVADFWTKEAIKVGGEASLANITPYITSKFNNFIANDYMRPIIGQTKSSFNFRNVMDEGKILLINLSKGKVGDINSSLLGMIVVGKLLMSAFARIDTPENERRDFNLYVDEFQNFATDSISTILSEARKYRLNLVVAHQFIGQLTEKIKDAVFGNVGSIVSFRVGAEDAEVLLKQFEPVFSQNDLINIDNLNALVKILAGGQTTKPFNIKTPLYPSMDMPLAHKIIQESFEKYGADRQAVEQDILTRLRN